MSGMMCCAPKNPELSERKIRKGSLKSMRDIYRCDFCGKEENTGTVGNLISGRLTNGLDFQFCGNCRDRLNLRSAEIIIDKYGEHDETFSVKEDTHVVLKEEDISKYLTSEEQGVFDMLYEKIMLGRNSDGKTCNKYYIINHDEPYSEKILDTIRDGEIQKRKE